MTALVRPTGVALWPADRAVPRRGAIEVAQLVHTVELSVYRGGVGRVVHRSRRHPSDPAAPALLGEFKIDRQGAAQCWWALHTAVQSTALDVGLTFVQAM